MDFKIDWLTLTLKPVNGSVSYKQLCAYDETNPLEHWCFEFLELFDIWDVFKKKQGSIQHYNTMYRYNGIDIALSNADRFQDQGIMFRFSGDGIAFYEKIMRKKCDKWNWITFLKEFFSLGVFGLTCKCTRIDLAYDDISYSNKHLIDLNVVANALRCGEFVSAFRTTDNLTPHRLIPAYENIKRNTKGEVLGETYYVGNRKSKVFLRFYDKLLECKAKNEPYDEKIKHWVRMEFEFKDVRAMSVCDSLIMLSSDEFGSYMSQVTNHYIRFVIPHGVREQYCRCPSADWWYKVVNTVEKAKLTENKAYRNRFNSTLRWLRRQVFPTLYAVLSCIKIDEFLTDVRDIGLEKNENGQNSNYNMIVNDFFSDRLCEKYNGIEIHKASYNDFESLVSEFDKCAYSSKMRLKALHLCRSLGLEEEKKKLLDLQIKDRIEQHNKFYKTSEPVIYGMYNLTILDFLNEKQATEYPF